MATRAVNLLFYAINGTGLGHLSRLLNIARSAETYLKCLGIPSRIQFLTTSEGSEIAGDYPVYKIPSKTIVNKSELSSGAYRAQAKLFISNVVAGIKPDILILDTVPEGSFKEFLFLKDYAKKTAFVYRHMIEERQRSETVQAHLSLYDLILIPDKPSEKSRYVWPKRKTEAIEFVGCIHGFQGDFQRSVGFPHSQFSELNRESIRNYFGVPDNKTLIYVSAGGGGDKKASQDLKSLIEVLSQDQDNVLLIGYGPLYQGPKLYRANVIPLSEPGVSRYFPGMDIAVSAAGYNSYNELLAAGVPTLFYAQEKGWDNQQERIDRGFKQGWHERLSSFDPLLIQTKIAALKDPENRFRIQEKLAQRDSQSGASLAASALLELHSRLGESNVPRRELIFLRELIKTIPVVERPLFPEWYRCARGFAGVAMTGHEQSDFMDESRFQSGDDWQEKAIQFIQQGRDIHRWIFALDWRLEEWLRYARAMFQSAEALPVSHRISQVEDLFETLTSSLSPEVASELLRQLRRCLAKESLLSFFQWFLDELEDSLRPKIAQSIVDFCRGHDDEKLATEDLLTLLNIHEREAR